MIAEEKIKEIKKKLRNGIPEGEIKNDLINEGYSQQNIDKAFRPHKYDMRNWYLTFAVIFLISGIYLFAVMQSFLLMIFSAVLFSMYYNEKQRKQKELEREQYDSIGNE